MVVDVLIPLANASSVRSSKFCLFYGRQCAILLELVELLTLLEGSFLPFDEVAAHTWTHCRMQTRLAVKNSVEFQQRRAGCDSWTHLTFYPELRSPEDRRCGLDD